LWSNAGKVEGESGMKEREKKSGENERSQKRHGVRDRDRDRDLQASYEYFFVGDWVMKWNKNNTI